MMIRLLVITYYLFTAAPLLAFQGIISCVLSSDTMSQQTRNQLRNRQLTREMLHELNNCYHLAYEECY